MKRTLGVFSAVFLLVFTFAHVNANVIAGPFTNPANGHDYYLLGPDTWSNSEAEAESLGGTLAIIKNASEQNWIYSTFASHGNLNRVLWIGLHGKYSGGPFIWVNGEGTNSNYQDWCDGQPDNGGGIEDSVDIWTPNNAWNDARNGEENYGIAEVRGKSLTDNEKSLVGIWYAGGNIGRPCYFAATNNRLFAISNDGRAWIVTRASGNFIFVANWNTRGEIIQDHILWSDGTWWSRKPSNYATDVTPEDFPVPRF